jgi:hypothetical protein
MAVTENYIENYIVCLALYLRSFLDYLESGTAERVFSFQPLNPNTVLVFILNAIPIQAYPQVFTRARRAPAAAAVRPSQAETRLAEHQAGALPPAGAQ